jgi:pyruvate carboxylase
MRFGYTAYPDNVIERFIEKSWDNGIDGGFSTLLRTKIEGTRRSNSRLCGKEPARASPKAIICYTGVDVP